MLNQTIICAFENIVGERYVKSTNAQLQAYSYDATANFQHRPDLVVSPKTTEQIADIVKLCSAHNLPIVPRGSGTNLAAGTVPNQGGVVVLFGRMDDILDFDQQNLTLTVQPGVITQDINTFLEPYGLFYPPDPSSMKISTIGGNVSENSGGLRGLKYGVTKDYILGLTVVLPNGEVFTCGGKLAKDVAGYDMKNLFVGAEGTLGIITEITLKLIPLPRHIETCIAYFNSLEEAAQTVSSIIEAQIIPATLEFLDRGTLHAVEGFMKIGLPLNIEAFLLMEQDGDAHSVKKDIAMMQKIAEENGATHTEIARDAQHALELKTARRVALSALARQRPTTVLEDATVPRAQIAPMVRKIQEIAQKHNIQIATFGHAGDGNLHPTCLTDARDAEEMERVERALDEIFDEALKLGGTITGEHGVGEMKSPYLQWRLGDTGITLMKSIKQAIDPQNIMNPGKIFAKETKKRVVVTNE